MPPKGFFNKEAAKAALPLNRSFSGFLAHDPSQTRFNDTGPSGPVQTLRDLVVRAASILRNLI